MELKGFLQVVNNRKWLLLAIVSVSVIATYLIAIQAPASYKSRIRLVAGITQGGNSLFSLDQERGLERYEVEARFRNMEEMIRSPRVLSLVSYQLMIHDLTEGDPFGDLNQIFQKTADDIRVMLRTLRERRDSMEMLSPTDELEKQHLASIQTLEYDHENLREHLDVRRIPGTDFISVEFTGSDPDMSAFVVNQVGREFIRYYLLTNSSMAQNMLSTMSELVTERRQILDEKLKEWSRYNQQQTLQATSGGTRLLDDIDDLETAREESEQQILVAERLIIKAEQGLPRTRSMTTGPSPESFGEGQLLRSRIQRLTDAYIQSGMIQTAFLDSIDMVRTRLIDLLVVQEQSQMGDPDSEVLQLIRASAVGKVDLFIHQSRITSIARQLRRLAAQAGSFNNPELAATVYGREVQVARDAYLTALQRFNSARLGYTESTPGTVSQVEFAQVPQQPEPSTAFLSAALAGFIALGIGLVVLLLLEYLDESIKLPSRFTTMTSMPLLGSLVRLKSSNLDLVSLFHETQSSSQFETYKQQLRILRHEIILKDPVTLLLTSTRSGAGKSSLLISLAYSLSLTGKKVLMVDTNLVNGSLTDMTGASPTLQKYLSGDLPGEALISPSVFDNVDVIGCAVSKSSPAEAFKHDAFEQLLVSLSDDYDHILMEGAALNEYVDARELLLYSAKILPVFAADAPVEEADLHHISYLLSHKEKLLGAILNKVEARHLNH